MIQSRPQNLTRAGDTPGGGWPKGSSSAAAGVAAVNHVEVNGKSPFGVESEKAREREVGFAENYARVYVRCSRVYVRVCVGTGCGRNCLWDGRTGF